MKILTIVAGTNDPSNSKYLADCFCDGIREIRDVTVEKIRLKDLHIDHFTLMHYEAGADQGEDFRKVQTMILEADGVVIASPVWNFSVPAHLKNLIDRMGSFGLESATHSVGTLNGKPFYLLFTGGSPAVAWKGLMKKTTSHVPVSIRYFGGAIIGSHYEERCTKGRGVFGCVLDARPGCSVEARRKGREFAEVVQYFVKTGRLPLKQRMIAKIFQIAQKIKRKLGL